MAEKKLPFEKIFPYLSYRWKYDDGEYSPYAPFTEVLFIPETELSDQEKYENGFNVFMTNDTEKIIISQLPIGGPDVVAIDILYTESISSTIYILKTLNIALEQRGKNYLNNITISRRSIGTALPPSQLNRHFDSVPRFAKAQETTANRIMYGNYVSKYNQEELDINGMQGPVKIQPFIEQIPSRSAGKSVKTNRDYEIGVVYIDKFGRQGGLLVDKAKPGDTSEGSSIKTDFTYTNLISLGACIKSNPPSWAKYYRYFVKDTSADFNNLTAYNTYNDVSSGGETPNVYLQFKSTDRNKLTEDTFLIPRRHNHLAAGNVTFNESSKIPILAIENEAPDVVKGQLTGRITSNFHKFDYKDATLVTSETNDAVNALSVGQTVIYIKFDRANYAKTFSKLEEYFAANNNTTKFNEEGTPPSIVDCTIFPERLAMQFIRTSTTVNYQTVASSTFSTKKLLIDSIQLLPSQGSPKNNLLKITVSKRIDDNNEITSSTGVDIAGINLNPTETGQGSQILIEPGFESVTFFRRGLSSDAQDKLKGSFFVKVPRSPITLSANQRFNTRAIPIGQSEFDEDGKVESLKYIDFETEPGDDSNLDLYWETAKTFTIDEDHGKNNIIPWSNCIATIEETGGEIYLESTRILDKFNSTQLVKSIRVNTPDINYAEEKLGTGLIFSGLYNSRTGINELNQFSLADGITKNLEPNYGSIQKLFALDTNLIALAEDKVFKILADKDALFNADEGVNVTATNLVLGQAMSYQGNYGISTHPESFAFFNNNAYFTDAKRGVVLQLSPANGQIFPISSIGMSNFFRDRLGALNAGAKLIGAYNGYKKQYLISIQGYNQNATSIGSETIPNETSEITLAYSPRAKGWTSRFSFVPEFGVTLNSKFYTFKNGKAYLHNSNTAARNNFYGVQYNSEVQVIFNDNPTFVSDWLSINYEGSEGWEAIEIIGDQDSQFGITNVRILDSEDAGFLGWFLKEGKYRGAIVGTQPVYIIDPGGSVGSDGLWPLIQDGANTQDISGTKGFFQKTRFRNSGTTAKELFAVSSEYYISQT